MALLSLLLLANSLGLSHMDFLFHFCFLPLISEVEKYVIHSQIQLTYI